MDGTRFDALTRTIAATTSRRRFLGGLAAGLVAGLTGLGRRDVAGACAGPGRVCRGDGGCCSGICAAKDETGRRRCVCPTGQIVLNGDCVDPIVLQSDPQNCGGPGIRCPGDQCSMGVCTNGVCGLAPNPSRIGQSCDDGKSCITGETCQADGTCGGGTAIQQLFPCGNGGRCYQGSCILAYPNCGGSCSANAASPERINMCWGISGFCGNAQCSASTDCPPGYFCGYTNSCGNGFESVCFEGCSVDS